MDQGVYTLHFNPYRALEPTTAVRTEKHSVPGGNTLRAFLFLVKELDSEPLQNPRAVQCTVSDSRLSQELDLRYILQVSGKVFKFIMDR